MPPTKPVLDSSLAADCPALNKPDKANYDDWEDYSIEVIGKYGDCAALHHKTVQAWPK